MNKKGFTLIEILSVIVLISLLLGVGIAGINRISTNMKDKSYETKIRNIEQAAILYGQDNKTTLQSDDCKIDTKDVKCKKISVYGLIKEDYLDSEDYNKVEFNNPKDNKSMLNNCIYIYKKNNRVEAYYTDSNCSGTNPNPQNQMIISNFDNAECELLDINRIIEEMTIPPGLDKNTINQSIIGEIHAIQNGTISSYNEECYSMDMKFKFNPYYNSTYALVTFNGVEYAVGEEHWDEISVTNDGMDLLYTYKMIHGEDFPIGLVEKFGTRTRILTMIDNSAPILVLKDDYTYEYKNADNPETTDIDEQIAFRIYEDTDTKDIVSNYIKLDNYDNPVSDPFNEMFDVNKRTELCAKSNKKVLVQLKDEKGNYKEYTLKYECTDSPIIYYDGPIYFNYAINIDDFDQYIKGTAVDYTYEMEAENGYIHYNQGDNKKLKPGEYTLYINGNIISTNEPFFKTIAIKVDYDLTPKFNGQWLLIGPQTHQELTSYLEKYISFSETAEDNKFCIKNLINDQPVGECLNQSSYDRGGYALYMESCIEDFCKSDFKILDMMTYPSEPVYLGSSEFYYSVAKTYFNNKFDPHKSGELISDITIEDESGKNYTDIPYAPYLFAGKYIIKVRVCYDVLCDTYQYEIEVIDDEMEECFTEDCSLENLNSLASGVLSGIVYKKDLQEALDEHNSIYGTNYTVDEILSRN